MKIELEIGKLPEDLLRELAASASAEAGEPVTPSQAFCDWLEAATEVKLEDLFDIYGVDEDTDVPDVKAKEIK